MNRVTRMIIGWLFIAVGVTGILVPIMPGWILLGPGILFLSADMPYLARLVCWVEGRYPRLAKILIKIHAKLRAYGVPHPPCVPKKAERQA